MRLLLVLLTLALLPLQGWAIPRVAPAPAATAAHAINNIADQSIDTWAGGIFCPENQAPHSPCAERTHAAHPGVAHGLCQAGACCQMCHAALLLPLADTASGPGRALPVRAAGPRPFASVPAAPLLRPPIS